MRCAHVCLSVGVCVRVSIILGRREIEPQLSKQVFNMLSGFSSLQGKHMHTLAHRHKAHQDGTGSSLCGTEVEIETAQEWFQLEDKDNSAALLPLCGRFVVFI